MTDTAPTSTDYADVEIRILPPEVRGYPIEVTVNSEQEYPRGYLDPAFLPWVPGASSADDGVRLFAWLFADVNMKQCWAQVRGQHPHRRLRMRIDDAAPELHTIPWELLRQAEQGEPALDLAAADATPFSRYLAGAWQPGGPILKRPVKILVAIANPANLSDLGLVPISVEEEWAALQAATAGSEVELTLLPQHCTLAALEAELRKGYHVLHFVGHGAFFEGDRRAVLYLADPDNVAKPTPDADIAEMLARQLADAQLAREDKLRLVFLASCQSATRSPADAFRGLAPALVQAGVPAVVAMQDLVPVATAQEFARIFYRQLLYHGLVDLAANQARSALLAAHLTGASIPVLFLRVRSGELLGRRGRVQSDAAEQFWPFLLGNIADGRCAVFLGPHASEGLLPGPATLAEKLARKYSYPLPDTGDLARVAQFAALQDPRRLRTDYLRLLQRSLFPYLGLKPTDEQKRQFDRATFSETAAALGWAQHVLDIRENEIHHLLADLSLPLYVTTNPDSLMFEALRSQNPEARRVGLRWSPQAGTPQYLITPAPSPDRPVVLHLNGYDGDDEQQEHLVLTEDDFLAHFVRLSRDQDRVLPANVLGQLSEFSFLFVGYRMGDWEFRMVLQGLLQHIAQTAEKKLHVGVQLGIDQWAKPDAVMDYLRSYLRRFSIDVYWGTPQQFAGELHSRWQEYLAARQDEWNT